jgi:PAS domain S-box-containing protein
MENATILLVDDEPIILRSIGSELEQAGYRVKTANSGEAAIEALSENPIDLVVTDLVMEGVNGLGVLERAKQLNPHTIVIILTGYGDMDSSINALRLGADDFLAKPCDIREFRFRVERCLERLKLKKENARQKADLISSGKRWQACFNAMSDAIFLIDSDQKISQCNEAATEFLGKTEAEILGHGCHQLVHGSPEPIEGCPFARSLKTRQRESMVLFVDDRWIMVTADPFLDEAGSFLGAVHVMRDITDMKRVELELKEKTGRLRDRVNELKCLYGISSLAANPDLSMEDICGEVVKLIPLSLKCRSSSRIHMEGKEYTTENFKETEWKLTRSITVKDKPVGSLEAYCLEELSAPGEVPFSGEEKALIHDVADRVGRIGNRICEKKKKEKLRDRLQQSKKLESLGVLAGGIAHDFNNLLAVILGNIDLAKMYVEPDTEIDDVLSEAMEASLQAKLLSRQFLTFASGGSPVRETGSIVEPIRDCVRISLSGSNVKGDISLPDTLWPVSFDSEQMKQVVGNMVINAREAMDKGGVLRVTGENVVLEEGDVPKLKAGKYVKISLEDNGIGIPEENLQKVFDPYFSTKEMGERKGSGLGLSICHSIIHQHGGVIDLVSEEGVGTTLCFYLPACEGEVAERAPVEKTVAAKPAVSGRDRILVMDDEESVRRLMGQMLNRAGYTVAYAEDGEKAVEVYRKGMESGDPFDGVILDLTVKGGMGGEEAVKRLIEMDPEARVMIASGYSKDPVLMNFREYGFIGAITKPFMMHELHAAVRALVSEKEQTSAP